MRVMMAQRLIGVGVARGVGKTPGTYIVTISTKTCLLPSLFLQVLNTDNNLLYFKEFLHNTRLPNVFLAYLWAPYNRGESLYSNFLVPQTRRRLITESPEYSLGPVCVYTKTLQRHCWIQGLQRAVMYHTYASRTVEGFQKVVVYHIVRLLSCLAVSLKDCVHESIIKSNLLLFSALQLYL